MKKLFIALTSLLMLHHLSEAIEYQTIGRSFQAGENEREFYKKEVLIKFDTAEEARNWSLQSLDFKSWLDLISDKNWVTLKTFEQDEFYFAIFRSGNHLIFCKLNKKGSYSGSSKGLRAVDESIRYDVHKGPSLWSTFHYTLSHPKGSRSGQTTFITWELIDNFTGELILNYSVKNEETPYKKVFHEKFQWTTPRKQDAQK